MKRAFIRLFGCVLSAIGLSMSYDTTLTVLLDDDSMPGVAYAAAESGTGTGSGSGGTTCSDGYNVSGCMLPVVGAGSGWDVTGICDHGGHRMQYFTKFITGWYVGWPNYKGGGVSTDVNVWWPYPVAVNRDQDFSIYFDVKTSGAGSPWGMSGTYAIVRSDKNGNVFDLCSGTVYDCLFDTNGPSHCVDANGSYAGLYATTCITNITDNYGGRYSSNGLHADYQQGPIYMRGSGAFVAYGCGLANSNGTCASSYKCCYGPTTNVYTVTGCGNLDSKWYCGSITTQRVAQPIVFYQFSGCIEQTAPNAVMTGADGRWGMDGFAPGGPYQLTTEGGSACPVFSIGNAGRSQVNPYESTSSSDVLYKFRWLTCEGCPGMTSIYNSSSFSPSITSMGTVTYLPSATVNTCKASVKGNKDASGTFDIVEPCTY